MNITIIDTGLMLYFLPMEVSDSPRPPVRPTNIPLSELVTPQYFRTVAAGIGADYTVALAAPARLKVVMATHPRSVPMIESRNRGTLYALHQVLTHLKQDAIIARAPADATLRVEGKGEPNYDEVYPPLVHIPTADEFQQAIRRIAGNFQGAVQVQYDPQLKRAALTKEPSRLELEEVTARVKVYREVLEKLGPDELNKVEEAATKVIIHMQQQMK